MTVAKMDDHPMTPTPSDLSAVDRELARLPELHGGEAQAMRACTLNLVAVVTGARMAAGVSRLMGIVSQRYPSRAVIIHYRPKDSPPELSNRVSGHCRLTAGGQHQICCEQIDLMARGHLTKHLPSALAALLASDLPVYLWWLGPLPPRDPILERLAAQADALVTTADGAADPLAAIRWLSEYGERHGGSPFLSDTAWVSLGDWQSLITRTFDRPPPGLPWTGIHSVHIRHADRQPGAAALLLGGWIASRLGWGPGPAVRRGASLAWQLVARGRPASLSFTPGKGKGGPEQILSVTLSAGKRKPLTLHLGMERRMICAVGPDGSVSSLEMKERLSPRADRLPPEETICRILGSPGPDPAFPAALRLLTGVTPAP